MIHRPPYKSHSELRSGYLYCEESIMTCVILNASILMTTVKDLSKKVKKSSTDVPHVSRVESISQLFLKKEIWSKEAK